MLRKWLEKFRTDPRKVDQQKLSLEEKALNEELESFWYVTNYIPRDEHKAIYRALFMQIMRALESFDPSATMKSNADQVLLILRAAKYAARLRQDRLLPAGRANTDYRKYEAVYTHALVTAVAVEGAIRACGGVSAPIDTSDPKEIHKPPSEAVREAETVPAGWARVLISAPGLQWLEEDAMVWQDWQDYFEAPETSLMAALGRQGMEWALSGKNPESAMRKASSLNTAVAAIEKTEAAQRRATLSFPKKAGWDVIEAINTSLADGSLSSCQPQSIVQVDFDGRTFLRVPEIYDWYHEKYDLDSTPNTIRNRIKKIGVLERVKTREIFKGRIGRKGKPVQGIVITDSSLLWGQNTPNGSIVIDGIKGPV